MVICGFPGIGKSAISRTYPGVVDLESTPFEKDWNRYCKVISHMNKNYTVLCSSHIDLRKELNKNNINYIYVKPEDNLKEEYIERYKKRGNDEKFISQLEKNWDEYMAILPDENIFELREGEYLLDVLDSIKRYDFEEFEEMDSSAVSAQAPENLRTTIIMSDDNSIEDLKKINESIEYFCVD